ncbi:chromate transporter [Mycoplasmopsis edwardii]|uniref:Chromate transporter n=1 Tax=Mycoplasmopsis edwardii TaxID=53558 RepID=A0ACD4PH87_9BACT|nr:chromate transporter [Mycoplasmopsis edwardii]WBP83952.1 chromate transporter [Mycoplasmopsis edwardii]
MFSALLLALPLLILISLSVFGGGQVFMPVFQWFWTFLSKLFNININDEIINNVFTVSNSTPGVVSTKFAFFTGYLVSNAQWWGFLAVFLTYLIFCLPAIFIMLLTMKYIQKFKTNTYIKNALIIIKPIVAGIMISLALQLFISIFAPEIFFNQSNKSSYAGLNTSHNYFVGYKNIILKIYILIGIPASYFLVKKKFSLFLIIVINVVISLILFAIPYA